MNPHIGKLSSNLFASDADMIEYTVDQIKVQNDIKVQEHAKELFEALKIVVANQPMAWFSEKPKGYKQAIAVLDKLFGC